jgi:hypothetical protein
VRYTELSPTRFKDFWRDTASGEGIWARSEDSGTSSNTAASSA